jgi:hypothetical protein
MKNRLIHCLTACCLLGPAHSMTAGRELEYIRPELPGPPDSCENILLGSLTGFVVFTSNGAVPNTGSSYVTGDLGTHIGAISGFGTSTVNGSFYNSDVVTQQAVSDLTALHVQLTGIPVTNASHAPAYGGEETLTAGVYEVGSAGSLNGNLYLDAAGDPDATFIFRFGGAFSAGAASAVILLNGAQACRVFWIAEGAIAVGATTSMKGTLLANNAANSMAAGGDLDGRLFSTTGAIALDNVTLMNPGECACTDVAMPVELLVFTAACNGNGISFYWETGSELDNHHFSVERKMAGNDWELVRDIAGAGNSTIVQYYTFADPTRYYQPAYFRLSQTDMNGAVNRHTMVYVPDCGLEQKHFSVSPNPSGGTFVLTYAGNTEVIVSMTVYDLMGQTVYACEGFESMISLEGMNSGVFFLHLDLGSEKLTERLIVEH